MFVLSTDYLVSALVFILVFSIFFKILNKKSGNFGVSLIIALAVSFMTLRFLSLEQRDLIFNMYSAGGMLTALFFPALIIFWFLYYANTSPLIRRSVWALYYILLFFVIKYYFTAQNLLNEFLIYLTLVFIIILIFDSWIKKRIDILRYGKKH